MVQNSLLFFFATVHELRILVLLGIGLVWPAAIVVANKKGMKSSIQQRSKEENELLKSTALSPTILGLRFSFSPQVLSITPFLPSLSHTRTDWDVFLTQVVSIRPFLPSLSHTKTDWDVFLTQVVSITPFLPSLSHTKTDWDVFLTAGSLHHTFLPSLSHTKTDWDTHDEILSCRDVCILYKWGCTNWWLNNNVTRGTSELYNQ